MVLPRTFFDFAVGDQPLGRVVVSAVAPRPSSPTVLGSQADDQFELYADV